MADLLAHLRLRLRSSRSCIVPTLDGSLATFLPRIIARTRPRVVDRNLHHTREIWRFVENLDENVLQLVKRVG